MSQTRKPKQPVKIITKENDAECVNTRARKIQQTGSKLQTAKGNDKLFNVNIISTHRSPVLQDRTNLILEPIKVVSKNDKNKRANSNIAQVEPKRTRFCEPKDDKDSKHFENKTTKKKCSPPVDIAKNLKEEDSKKRKNIKDSVPLESNKIIRSTRNIIKVTSNKLINDINTAQASKKDVVKTADERIETEVNTKKIVSNNKLEAPHKKIIVKSKIITRSSKDSKQEKISTMKLRKNVISSEESEKLSKDVQEQKKKSTVKSVTQSKNTQKQNNSNPSSTTEKPETSKTKSKTQSNKDVNVEKNTDDESKSLQSSQKSKSKIPMRQSSKDLSLRKPQRSSTRIKNTASNNKFFKNKVTGGHSKISPLKRAVIGLGRKNTKIKKARVIPVLRESSSFRLRQTTLKESFSNCNKKLLRPRIADKNYCEVSQIVKKVTSPKKGPIYNIKALDKSQEKDKEKVYDFIPDKNDSSSKKRKKRVRRNIPTKKAKTVSTKNNTDTVPVVKTLNDVKAAKNIKMASSNDKHIGNDKKSHSKETVVPKTLVKPSNTAMNSQTIEVIAEIYSPPSSDIEHEETDIHCQETVKLSEKPGPKIISDYQLGKECCINITGTPLQPKLKEEEFSRPFRATNAFNMKPSMQMKTMMDHSLIRRSLSPISKANTPACIDDIGSPWRPIIPSAFSRVKNVVQSTPQGEKFMSITTKTALGTNKQLFNAKLNKIVEQKNENNNISKNNQSPVKKSNNISKSPIKRSDNSNSPRKFGVEISNINAINDNKSQRGLSKSPQKSGSEIFKVNKLNVSKPSPVKNKSPRQVEVENLSSVMEIPRISLQQENVSNYDEIIEDKENSAPNEQNSKEIIQTQSLSNPQQERVISQNVIPNVEMFEPQPGPSGLQKSHSPIDAWNLKQMNLNKFLNLPDMPEKTLISTAQGIFDDIHSTPITGKGVKRLVTQLDVADAFGFDESDNSFEEIENISPIQKELIQPSSTVFVRKQIDDVQKNNPQINKNHSVNPMRISVGEIKKTLRNNEEKDEGEGKILTVNQISNAASKKDVVKAITFTDTFDVINEEKNTQDYEETIKEVPLFVDLEPVHFHQPPRYSYKRKRFPQFNTEHENEDDKEDEEFFEKRPQKKKKIRKAEREQKKKLDDWAESINRTFEEIDHFSLIVE